MRSGRSLALTAALVFTIGSGTALAVAAPADAGGRSYYTCQTASLTNGGRTVNAKSCTGTGGLTGTTTLV